MDKKIIGAVSGVVLAVAVTGTVLVTQKSNVETPVTVVTEQPTEAETVGTAIKLLNGKVMHVFGIYNDKRAVVVDSVHGRTVILDSIVNDVTCNILLDAKIASATQTKITKIVNGKSVIVAVTNPELPDIPKLSKVFGVVSWPVRIPGSDNKANSYLWEVLLRGVSCKIAGEDPSFVASSPKEFAMLPDAVRDRAKALISWYSKD